MSEDEEARAISQLIVRQVLRFPALPVRLVEEMVSSAHPSFAGARVRNFIPLLAEHDLLVQLKDLTAQGRFAAAPA
jgi:hypothetical protein